MIRRGAKFVGTGIWFALLTLAIAGPVCAQQAPRIRRSPRYVAELIRELKSPDLNDRKNAARALSTIEPLPPEAIQALADLLEGSQHNDRAERYAISALGKAGTRAIPVLTPLLESNNPQARVAAVMALGGIGARDPSVWPILIGTFKQNSVRWDAARQLATFGAPVVPLLRKALADNDPTIRQAALVALEMAPGAARDATVEIAGALKDPDISFRIQAARDLALIGMPGKTAVTALSSALNDNRREVRDEAAMALARVDPSDKAPIPILIENLKLCRYLGENWRAVEALCAMGSDARDAIPSLEEILVSDQNPSCRAPIAKALGRIAGAGAVLTLARALTDDKDSEVRSAALTAIRELGPDSASATPALVKALGDGTQAIRGGASETLAGLGKAARPALIAALQNSDLYTREWAILALAREKPLSAEVVQALTATATNDKSKSLKMAAAEVLDRAGVEAGHTTLVQLQGEDAAGNQEEQGIESNRLYSRAEIFADIPPGNEHEYPLHLVSLLSFDRFLNRSHVEFLATIYRGIDRPDRFDVWKSVDGERYQRLQIFDAGIELQPSDKFDPPRIFFLKGQVPGLPGVQILDVGMSLWRGHTDFLFAIEEDKLSPVEIESPEQWYRSKLRPGEEIEGPAENSFSDTGLEFQFYIRSGRGTEKVVGTYKLIKDTEVHGGTGLFFPATGEKVISVPTPPTNKWKIVVDTAQRKPLP